MAPRQQDPLGRNGNTSGFGSGRPTVAAPQVVGYDGSGYSYAPTSKPKPTSTAVQNSGQDAMASLLGSDDDMMDNDFFSTLENWWTTMNEPPPTGGGGSSYGNVGAMLAGLGQGAFGPQQAPQFQQMGAPAMQQVASMPALQQIQPEQLPAFNTVEAATVQAQQLPEYQQFNPTLLQYQDFSPLRQSLSDIAAQTQQTVSGAFNPLIERLSQPQQTSIGNVVPEGQQMSPELAQLAALQGVGDQYQQALGAANSGVRNVADLFAGRGVMLDRALSGARDMSLSGAQMAQAAGLSNVDQQRMLAEAALNNMQLQSNMGIDASNNALMNQAGQMNSQGLNNWALTQAGMNQDASTANAGYQNQANMFNSGGLNDWAMAQSTIDNNANIANTQANNEGAMAGWNAQNQANNFNAAVMNEWLAANNQIANEQAAANAAAGQPNTEALLNLILQSAGMGQTIDPSVLSSLLGTVTV